MHMLASKYTQKVAKLKLVISKANLDNSIRIFFQLKKKTLHPRTGIQWEGSTWQEGLPLCPEVCLQASGALGVPTLQSC